MCTVCGCGQSTLPDQVHFDQQNGVLDFGKNQAGVSLPHISEARTVTLQQDVLSANQAIAQKNRAHFQAHGVIALNFVSSPGSGKTTLLCKTIEHLYAKGVQIAVIEGDQQTSNDAERIRQSGAPAIQVNTGHGCHLDALMVESAFSALSMHTHAHEHEHEHEHEHHHHEHHEKQFLLIENVGNLVCPAMWDLGENAKVAILSVTEGEDKPLKYPDMFAAARIVLINKIDLLPYVPFDLQKSIEYIRRVNPKAEIFTLSATSGEGFDAWIERLMKEEF